MPLEVLLGLVGHPMTDRGQEQFLADWERAVFDGRSQGATEATTDQTGRVDA
jgi:hypothetical protein